MRVAVVGGGPAGLYFALLLKKANRSHDVTVFERNPAGATYGWGVVFSDRTLTSFREADFKTYSEIIDDFVIWDSIDVRFKDEVIRCGGQVFSGIARKLLLGTLQRRCAELGVTLRFETELTDLRSLEGLDLVVAADGIRSAVRDAYSGAFRPRIQDGLSRYIWYGTPRTFDSFTFCFRSNDDGFFQAHAYPFDGTTSTFIVECDEGAWRRAGLDRATEAASIEYCERLFAKDLRNHPLMSNNSKWINFETLTNKSWHQDNVVLIGDAAHTAHFSIGSGTKLAMEDSIALANGLEAHDDVGRALADYQLERKPRVERLQEAARQSQTYFESTSRYGHMEPLQFAFHLLSRSGRIDYDNLRLRDPTFVASVDRWFASSSPGQGAAPPLFAAPPAFAPTVMRGLELTNRVLVGVAPSYESEDGSPAGVDLETPARSGAGLVLTDVVAVSAHARITSGSPGLYTDAHASAWKGIVDSAHAVSSARFALSLGHSGARGSTLPRTLAADMPLERNAWRLLAASALPYTARSQVPVEMDRSRMKDVLADFVVAAGLARTAEFDVLEVHMAHGYLLAGFISPLTNRRGDDFGGSPQARWRYPLEVFDAVRLQWSESLPLGVALTASDWAKGGIELDEVVKLAGELRERGCDSIRVVAGQTTARSKPLYDSYFLTHYADRIRNEAGVTTIATGDIASVDHVNTIVAGGRADLCAVRAGG